MNLGSKDDCLLVLCSQPMRLLNHHPGACPEAQNFRFAVQALRLVHDEDGRRRWASRYYALTRAAR
jgi:hypothetical protein